MSFRLVEAPNEQARVEWLGTVEHSADALVAADGDAEPRGACAEAETFPRDRLKDGPVAAKHIQHEEREAGISPRTLDRAKHRLGVKSRKTLVTWAWELRAKQMTGGEEAARG